MKVKKLGILSLLVLVTLCLLTVIAHADVYRAYKNKVLPAAGVHANLTASAPKPTSNYSANDARDFSDHKRLFDYWVDQQSNGQILPTQTIDWDGWVVAAYNKTLNSNDVQPRASTRSLFDPSLTVSGFFWTSYTP